MCCTGTICRICTCLIVVVVLIGLLFGFGVFKHGLHKLKDTIHYDCDGGTCSPFDGRRPFLGYGAPNPL